MKLFRSIIWGCAALAGIVSAPAQIDLPRGGTIELRPEAAGELKHDASDVRYDATVAAVAQAMPSVVSIATETLVKVSDPFEEFYREFYGQSPTRTQHNLGSGVMIDEDGYLLTNGHVVRRADKIQIQLATTHEVYDAKVIATDPKNDIALLKISAPPGVKFSAIKFAPDNDLLLGETVLALGNPFGLGGSISRGILSAKNRVIPTEGQELNMQNWLQTDAAINPGNSGGPLVNLRGELIGVNVAVLDQSGGRIARGIGFAIPVRQVNDALANAFTPESARQLWFGAHVNAGSKPLVITSVQMGSPAALAGLKIGDTVLKVNGKAPKSFVEFNELLADSPQTNVALAISRSGAAQDLTVRLVPEKSFFNAELVQRKLGIALQEITPQLAETLGLGATTGFIVAGVETNSPAAVKLQRGAIITAIDGQLPADLTTVAKILHTKSKGETTRLGVVLQQKQGNFVFYRQGVVEIPIR